MSFVPPEFMGPESTHPKVVPIATGSLLSSARLTSLVMNDQ